MSWRSRVLAIAGAAFACACAHGEPTQHDEFHWTGVENVVAIGDLHGDYDQYIKVMRDAGLVNSRGRWKGGRTHLVQTGDIPDRGPSSRKIIDHLRELKKQAERKGGYVHTLIGNHEAMNTYGDLRYVHPGEYEAFTSRNSQQLREQQWQFTLNQLQQSKPEEFELLDLEAYRARWEEQVPLGWVELRLNWAPQGEYGQWVLSNPVAVMVNDTIFLHGGISPEYCKLSLQELTEQAHQEILHFDPQRENIISDEKGPLWYRGLALENEASFSETLDKILERYGASRIVVGHTPTGGVVWPRFGQRVVVNDTGLAAYYGSNDGFLVLENGTAVAAYGDARLELPNTDADRIDYLEKVVALKPDNEALADRLALLINPPPPVPGPELDADALNPEAEPEALAGVETPLSPDICQPATH
ncbi:MAG: protein-tyrosine-phosphatase [Xanthomonadales bacterium]|nr:protein-tyrosine-phosphatase [Xanthomonadales bacterium]